MFRYNTLAPDTWNPFQPNANVYLHVDTLFGMTNIRNISLLLVYIYSWYIILVMRNHVNSVLQTSPDTGNNTTHLRFTFYVKHVDFYMTFLLQKVRNSRSFSRDIFSCHLNENAMWAVVPMERIFILLLQCQTKNVACSTNTQITRKSIGLC